MAITPQSDLVLGVVLAADPQKYRAAAERLRRLSTAVAESASPVATEPSLAAEPADSAAKTTDPVPAQAHRPTARIARKVRDAGEAFAQLEAFVLQSFIQTMLPKNAPNVFGKGTAGDVWKSMLAEKLGAEIARSGQLGIAKRLASGQAAAATGGAAGTASTSASVSAINFAPGRPPSSLIGVLPYLQPQPAAAAPDAASTVAADPTTRS